MLALRFFWRHFIISVKAGTRTVVPSPLEDERIRLVIVGTFFPQDLSKLIRDWTMERTRKQSILDTKQVMTGNVLFKKIKKWKYADNACNATFIKRPNIMRVFPNYAKDLDYASALIRAYIQLA